MNVFKRLLAKVKRTDQSTEPSEAKSTTETSKPYHVSQNKDKKSEYHKMWLVRREDSEKTIKHFDTQQEAIDHADALAKSQETTVVVHGMDGTIRKVH